MGGKSGSQTIGYHYLFSILFGLSRGPLNSLVSIKVGEKIAWDGEATDYTIHAITKPDLFGGEKKEGGIQGPFRLFPGDEDQVLPGSGSINCGSSGPLKGSQTLPDVKATIGGYVSEFRGTSMLWFDGLISSMNPYPKEWAFRVRRYDAGWHNDTCWYPKLARILLAGGAIHAMNPAHIIWECYTNPAWGRGLPWSMMDQNSFIHGANTFCDEGFGLCFRWQRKDDIDTFIANVQAHVDASTYLDPETGKMTLKLWRNDYIVDDLPLFTPSTGLLEIRDDDSSSQDATFNEMIGKGIDPITNEDFQLRAQNLAARQSQGAANPESKEYPGIPTRDLLARVLQRELKKHASGLKKFYITLDRRGWKLRPGMVFAIQDTRREIQKIILRAVEITDTDKRGRIEVRCIQDVFGLPATSFVTPTDPTWEGPPTEALPPTASKLFEANYRDLRIRMPASDITDLAGGGVAAMVALSPHPLMYQYELATKAFGEADFELRATGSFTGAATLVDAIGPYDVEFEITGETDFTDDLIGQVILLGEEQMGVVSYDADTHMLGVYRGVGDTIPAAHEAAEVLWTVDDDATSDLREYLPGETMEAAALTRGGGEVLSILDADVQSLDIVGRWEMPYPPGDVRVDGDQALDLPDAEYPEPTVTWTDRDRILQEEQIVAHEEGNIGPEPGTTYNIRILDKDDPTIVLSSHPGVTSGWQYDAALQATDGSPTAVWMELESERDGLTSFQHYRFYVVLTAGYGLGYGLNYGGA